FRDPRPRAVGAAGAGALDLLLRRPPPDRRRARRLRGPAAVLVPGPPGVGRDPGALAPGGPDDATRHHQPDARPAEPARLADGGRVPRGAGRLLLRGALVTGEPGVSTPGF